MLGTRNGDGPPHIRTGFPDRRTCSLTPQARGQLSQTLLQRSDDEFNSRGNTHIAAELLWGAVDQILRTVIDTDATLEFTGHASYRDATRRVEETSTEPFDAPDYNAANRLHSHFYQGQLTDQDLKYVQRVPRGSSAGSTGTWHNPPPAVKVNKLSPKARRSVPPVRHLPGRRLPAARLDSAASPLSVKRSYPRNWS